MVHVRYHTKKGVYETEGLDGFLSFIHTTKKGGYFFHPLVTRCFSHFNGLFLPRQNGDDWDLYKAIHWIGIEDQIRSADTNGLYTIVGYEKGEIEYFLHANGVLAITSRNINRQLQIHLDCRQIYDFGDAQRHYTVSQKDGCTVVTYQHPGMATLYIVIDTTRLTLHEHWFEEHYPYDVQRKTSPHASWVFDLGCISLEGVCRVHIVPDFSLESAFEKLADIKENEEYYKRSLVTYAGVLTQDKVSDDLSVQVAYDMSVLSVDSLFTQVGQLQGLYAGLPWFYQFWSRDEAVGLGALLAQQRYMDAKALLFSQIAKILDDGRIPNRHPHSMLASADGIGWVVKRVYDFLHAIAQNIDAYLTLDELSWLSARLEESLLQLESHHLREGLVYNAPLETWMDTGKPFDVREGFCIEIQAFHLLHIRCIHLIQELLGHDTKIWEEKESVQAILVRRAFVSQTLMDRVGDDTVRPNVFIAYYVYPWLLPKRQWKDTFDSCIAELYQEWGGFSTISRFHTLFCSEYTGSTNESYHRGDVWYWLNCLIGQCLLIDNDYRGIVKKIVEACVAEILTRSAIGRHAEVSSAKELSSHGCPMQLWSSSMFVELVQKLKSK